MKESFEYIELEQFVKNLDTLAVEPPEEIWQKLDAQLDTIPPNRRRKGPGPLYGGLITLAFLSMLTLMEGSVFYLFQQEIPRQSQIMLNDIVRVKEEITIDLKGKGKIFHLTQKHEAKSNSKKSGKSISSKKVIPIYIESQIAEKRNPDTLDLIEDQILLQEEAIAITGFNTDQEKIDTPIIQEHTPKQKTISMAPKVRSVKKEKKKRKNSLYLPPLMRKSWQRGRNWDFQLGIGGGPMNWLSTGVFNSSSWGSTVGLQGELVFSPYFRLATGASLIQVVNTAIIVAVVDNNQNVTFIANGSIPVNNTRLNLFHVNFNNTYFDVPVMLKTFLPLRDKRIEPYIGLGTTIEVANLRREIISLKVLDQSTNILIPNRQMGLNIQKFKFLAKAGAELKINRRINLQLGLAYQRENLSAHSFQFETSLWFTGNRGFFRFRREQ